MGLDYILFAVLVACLYTDLRFQKISNKVLFPATIVALAGNFYLGGLAGGLTSIKGLLLGMGLLMIPFVCGGMGAGDVKLLGVIGAFQGPEFVWWAFLATALIGGFLALIIMARSGQLLQRLKAVGYTLLSCFHLVPKANLLGTIYDSGPSRSFPYGLAIIAGTTAIYFLR